jgi:hypothetical protein
MEARRMDDRLDMAKANLKFATGDRVRDTETGSIYILGEKWGEAHFWALRLSPVGKTKIAAKDLTEKFVIEKDQDSK